ncbi:MAG: hypothetical protein GYB42_10080 [Alphaproteobacteria bacterium]|nr:hypothetical protein [Alphaproteobacteria bacterium]
MPQAVRRGDCSQCAALCCVAFAFDADEDFGLEKPANVACPKLTGDGRCSIHSSLADNGFAGCVLYDCGGVGQDVVQGLFAGRSWQDEPGLLIPMMAAFEAMRLARDLDDLLLAVGQLDLETDERERYLELDAALEQLRPWSRTSLEQLQASGLAGEVRHFVRTLAHHFANQA